MFEQINDNDKKAYSLIRNRLMGGLEAPTLREINKVINKSSPRSAVLSLERLEKAGLIKRIGRKIRLVSLSMADNKSVSTVEIPLVGSIAAGAPILAEENIEVKIPVSTALARPGAKYFLLRVDGTSMNLAVIGGNKITDNSIVLVRQQNDVDNGDIVVALIDDKATVKIFQRKNNMVILRPKSSVSKHKPIVLTENCLIQGKVVAVLPSDLY